MKVEEVKRPTLRLGNPEVARLLREWRKLKVNESNILVKETTFGDQIVLPPSLYWLVFQEMHEEMGHSGAERVYQLAKEKF